RSRSDREAVFRACPAEPKLAGAVLVLDRQPSVAGYGTGALRADCVNREIGPRRRLGFKNREGVIGTGREAKTAYRSEGECGFCLVRVGVVCSDSVIWVGRNRF